MNQETSNPFAVQAKTESNVAVASTRAAQEVQASMVIAKKFPRDEVAAFDKIMKACRRRTLAEQAIYTYPRGDTQVEGPSIRLAEALAQAWGNIDFGIIELEQRNGESSVMAFAWDLETNTRQTKIFNVKHERYTKSGTYKLHDPRDIYELTANQGARRLRACILGVIPGDVVEAATDECQKTLSTRTKEPLIDRVRKMVSAFGEMGITQSAIEKRLHHKLEATTEMEVVQLRKIFQSLKDGMAKREDFFEIEPFGEAASSKLISGGKKTRKQDVQQPPEIVSDESASGVAGQAPAPVVEVAEPASTGPGVVALEHGDSEDGEVVYKIVMANARELDINEAQLVQWAKLAKLASEKQNSLSLLATKKLRDICDQWPKVVREIQG